MIKKSRKKIKHLENEKSFEDGIKTIFHHFERAFVEINKTYFLLEGASPTLKLFTKKLLSNYSRYNINIIFVSIVLPCKIFWGKIVSTW